MGDVLAFARFAEAVALDRAREDHGRLAGVLDRGLVGVVHLDRIVTAEAQPLQLVVGQMLDHVEQPRVGAEEVLAKVGAALDGVLLVLAVDDLSHPLREQAVVVLREQRIPVAAPDHLDHVPSGAAEHGFQLLDDLTVAADRAVEPLQVAVDDEDEVLELLARREADRAERLRLVALAVAEKRPHLLAGRLLQAAVFEIALEPRLVDRHDRAEAHRHRGELPEVRHQPGMRIRRQPAAGAQLPPEALELLDRQPAFEKGARVDARRRVPLEVDDVPFVVLLALEEVIESDFVKRRGGRVGGDVSADAVRQPIGANDHRHRVPADEALDAALDLLAAGERRLVFRPDRIDVGGDGRERQRDAGHAGVMAQAGEQALDAAAVPLLDDVVERLAPLALFDGFQLGSVLRHAVPHRA